MPDGGDTAEQQPTGPELRTTAVLDPSRGVISRGLVVLGIAVREQPRAFGVAVGGSALFGVATVASSVVLGEVTDRVLVPTVADGEVATSAVVVAALALFAVGVTRAAGMFVRRLSAGVMQFRLQAVFRRRVTRQYLRLPLAWHQRHSTGSLLSNANADVEASWSPIAPLPFAVGVLVMLAVALGLLVATDPLLALVGCAVFPAFGVVNVVYGRRVSPLLAQAQQLRAEVSGVAHESFDGALVVKTLGRETEETRRFAVRAEQLRDAMVRAGRVRGTFDPVMEALPNLGVLVVLLVGAARIDAGALAVGDLVRVAYLFTLLAFPIRAIGWVFGELPRSVVGFSRVGAVLQARGEQSFGTALVAGSGPAAISLRNVTFRYTTGGSDLLPSDTPTTGDAATTGDAPPTGDTPGTAARPALSEVSFDIAPGQVVAVTGRTGSGKSTLVNLLVRLVDPDSGTIFLDGVALADAAPGEISRTVALVAQHAFLFDDTVRANVTLGALQDGDAQWDDQQVWDALARAQADGFVRALPDGLDTMVGERGTSLSGGQRQRIALARALVRRPRLLVLDDATSSVDPHVEASILAGLRDATSSSTVVVVAHRRATIALADEVVLLDGGRVAARGRHDDLLGTSVGYGALLRAYENAARERELTGAATADSAAPTRDGAPLTGYQTERQGASR